MSRLLLVRHATSVRPVTGGPDEYLRPLSEDGLRQADALAAELVDYSPGRILSSPYLRAVQTVRPAATALGLTVEPWDDLCEWRSGLAVADDWLRAYRYSWEHPDHRYEEGESHDELERRAADAVRSIAGQGSARAIVIGSHGTWISRALHGLGQLVDADFWFAMPMPALYEVTLDGGTVQSIRGPGLASAPQ